MAKSPKRKVSPETPTLTRLGKITDAVFGTVDNKIGITLVIGGQGWGIVVSDLTNNYAALKPQEAPSWVDDEYVKECRVMVDAMGIILRDAKVVNLDQLPGIPVEVITKGSDLVSWRVLKEVL